MIYDSHSLLCSWTSAIPVDRLFPGLATENNILLKCCPNLQCTYYGNTNEKKIKFPGAELRLNDSM